MLSFERLNEIEALERRNARMISNEIWFNRVRDDFCTWCDDGITQATRTYHCVPVCMECHVNAYLPENHQR